MKILVIEDEPKVLDFIQKALEQAGMTVDTVSQKPDLLSALKTSCYDVLVMDRLLPSGDTLELLPEIRKGYPRCKILVLSALSDLPERVKGLTEGADDYLGKPFHVSELLARVRSLARRTQQQEQNTRDTLIQHGELLIDLTTQKVMRAEKKIALTKKEFQILTLLASSPGAVYSKTQLLDQVWDLNHYPESNIIEVTIANLRSKLDRGFNPLIHSQRNVGYWFGEP